MNLRPKGYTEETQTCSRCIYYRMARERPVGAVHSRPVCLYHDWPHKIQETPYRVILPLGEIYQRAVSAEATCDRFDPEHFDESQMAGDEVTHDPNGEGIDPESLDGPERG